MTVLSRVVTNYRLHKYKQSTLREPKVYFNDFVKGYHLNKCVLHKKEGIHFPNLVIKG